MNTWDDFENEARLVEKTTNAQESGVVLLLKDSIGLFADAFSAAKNSDTSDATLAKMSLLSHSFGTLKCNGGRGYIMKLCQIFAYNFWPVIPVKGVEVGDE